MLAPQAHKLMKSKKKAVILSIITASVKARLFVLNPVAKRYTTFDEKITNIKEISPVDINRKKNTFVANEFFFLKRLYIGMKAEERPPSANIDLRRNGMEIATT